MQSQSEGLAFSRTLVRVSVPAHRVEVAFNQIFLTTPPTESDSKPQERVKIPFERA